MTKKPLPPLAWFRAFESAARHLNFTHAAHELSLTQSAVSQHIRSLENRLNCLLFVRQHRKLALTDEGRRLLPSVSKSIAQLRDATQLFDTSPGTSLLTLSVSASIAQWYLVPGLKEFLQEQPDLEVQIISKVWPDEFSGNMADVEIRFDSQNSAGDGFELMFPDSIVLIASSAAKTPLDQQPLIGVTGTSDTWKEWAKRNNHSGSLEIRSTVESHGMAVDCARADLGVALTSFSVAAPALADKSVALISSNFSTATDGYYVRLEDNDPSSAGAKFVEWLRKRVVAEKYRALDVAFGHTDT